MNTRTEWCAQFCLDYGFAPEDLITAAREMFPELHGRSDNKILTSLQECFGQNVFRQDYDPRDPVPSVEEIREGMRIIEAESHL